MSDQVANAIKITVSGTYAADAVEITLETGQGAELPDPSGDNYNLPWWDSTNYPDPADDPKLEIVRVTAKAGDVITVTRAQESTEASTKSTSGATYKMIMGVTAKTITDLIAETDAVGAGLALHMSDTSTHGAAEVADVATVSAEIDSDISTHVSDGDAHHAEAHSIASHNDTTATGVELEDLTDGSDADALHAHGANDTHRTSDGSDHTYVDQSVVNGASPAFLGTNITAIPAANLEFTVIGTPTYHNAQDWFNIIQSAGIIDGFVMSNGREPTELDVSAGKGLVKIIDSDIGATVSFEISAVENVTLTSNNINYIYVDYNAGTPQIVATTDRSAIEINRHFILGRVYKNGTTLHILNAGVHVPNLTRTEYERLVERDGFTHSSGVNVTETGALNLAITAGVWFMSHNRITTDAFDSSDTDTWIYAHYGAASWITDNAAATDVDCTHYNDGTDVLASLGSNNYSDQWIYITADSAIYIIYGTINGTLSAATDATPPTSLPKYVETMGELIAKMIVKQSGEIISIAMVHDVKFTAVGVPNHNDLGGLQGGAANDYYHLTSAEITDLTDAGESTLHHHASDRSRANHTGSQAVSTISDFDTEVANNSAVSANTSKVTNATHTGEVTGSGALTVDKTAITGKGVVTAVGADHVIISDNSDAGNLKKALISDFASAGGDMSAATYDPETIASDVFDMDNMVEGATTKILSDTERTKLTGIEAAADVTDAANVDSSGAVMEEDYNSHSILRAISNDTPVAMSVDEQTLIGRITAGNIAALTVTQIRTLLNVEDGAEVTSTAKVDSAGAVMESDYNAHTILQAASDDTPTALTVAEQTLIGRITAGNISALTSTQIRTLLNIEDGSTADQSGAEIKSAYEAEADTNAYDDDAVTKLTGIEAAADATDATNVNAAGAVMEEDYNSHSILRAISNDTPVAMSVDEQTLIGRITAGNIAALTVTQIRTLLNVADGADVTGSNAPQAHEASHKASGSDEILLDEFGTPTDVATLNATTGQHGLLKKLDNVATNFLNGQGNWAEPTGGGAHKDSHDPEDGADPLDTATPSELAGVQAAGEGSSHSLARADHAHAINHAITNNHLVTIDDTDAADNDYAKFTANGLEGRSYSEVISDLSLSNAKNASIWLPAEAAYLPATNPAGLVEELGATVYGGFSYLTFDDTTSEHAIWRIPMPDYDGGNIVTTAFSKVATTPSGAVTLQYNILTIGLATSEAFDAAVTVDAGVNISHSLGSDELLTDIMMSSATIDPANVASDNLLVIELSRDVASDDLSGDGELIGILIEYTRA